MGSLSTRRVIRRSAPAKITIVEDKGAADVSDCKENMVNCSLYSLFESRYERSGGNKPSAKSHSASAGDVKAKINNVLQPRKRSLNDRTVSSAVESDSPRELSPPELTTSDTFKPAKRTLGSKKPAEEGPKQQLPKIRTPVPSTSESCDVLVSSPTELKNFDTPERQQSKAAPLGKREVARKTPTQGRRFSIVRVSIVREGGGLLSSKRDGSYSGKNSTAEQANGVQVEPHGKEMVFSAKKRLPAGEQANRVQAEVEKARLRASERTKSSSKTTPVGKQGIGSFGRRAEFPKKDSSESVSPVGAQLTNSASKALAERIRTRKLSMVLKSEQRLVEKNEQYGLQLRQLQDQIEEQDHEMERLRTAALMLNNLINRQREEIRELRFRLKETFNENADVRDVCETLERELRQAREALRLSRMQQEPASLFETKLVSLTSRLHSMAITSRVMESCIEEGQEELEGQEENCQELQVCEGKGGLEEQESCAAQELLDGQEDCDGLRDCQGQGALDVHVGYESEGVFEVQEDVEGPDVIGGLEDCEGQEDVEGQSVPSQDTRNSGRLTSNEELLETRNDDDTQYTLQDLQEMVMQEEDLLKERCVSALRELNLPLTPLLTAKGSLDVDSLKTTLASISSREDYLTTERITSIRKLTAWIGSS